MISFFLLCTLMLTSSACGRDAFQRTECVTSAQCKAQGEICIQGECTPGPFPADMDLGGDGVDTDEGFGPDADTIACTNDSQCPVLPPDGAACAQSVCRLNRCVVIRPNCTEGTRLDPDQCVCVPEPDGDCETRVDCPAGYLCLGARCAPCTNDSQCAANERCGRRSGTPDNICLPRAQCLLDRDCQEGEVCLGGRCTDAPECSDTRPCRAGFECIDQRCFEQVCRGPEDCGADEVCDAGVCRTPDQTIASCFIATPDRLVLSPGDTLPLDAFALDAQGEGIAAIFEWTSSDAGILGINGQRAVAQPTGGTVTLGAQALTTSGTLDCGTIRVINLGPPPTQGNRFLVVDAQTGSPIQGAALLVGRGMGPLSRLADTDARGTSPFPSPPPRYDVTAIAPGYNLITLQGLSAKVVRIPLLKSEGTGQVAGFRGQFDFSSLTTGGDVQLGLAGASLPGGLINFNLAQLLGDPFVREVNLPQIGNVQVALPGGLVAFGQVFGLDLDIKKDYFASTSGGATLAWGLGGRVSALSLLGLFQGGIGTDLGEVLTLLLPLFNRFDHGMKPAQLQALPRVPDTQDVDGDGDRSELIPDYASFPTLAIKPSVPQRLLTSVSVSNLPRLGPGQANASIIVGGALSQSAGYVPLGISATTDADGDGRPDTRRLTLAPPYGALVGSRYALLSVAFRTDDLSPSPTAFLFPDEFSVALWNGQSFPGTIALGTFPDASTITMAPATGTLIIAASAGPVYRTRFVGRDRSWDIWTQGAPGVMGRFNARVTYPTLPAPFPNLPATMEKAFVDAIRTTATLDSLVAPGGLSLYDIGLLATGYNRTLVR